MFGKKVLMSASAAAFIATAFVATEDVSAASHKVSVGDTLYKISQAENVKVSDLQKWNNLQNNIIYPSQVIQVTKPSSGSSSNSSSSSSSSSSNSESSSSQSTYVVKSGDTLYGIARAHSTTAQKIASLSGISTSDIIHIGNKLTVSGKASSDSSSNSNDSSSNTSDNTNSKPPVNSGFSSSKLMNSADSVMGTKYVWGGTTQNGGFDCSGFIHWAYNDAGKSMGRTSTTGYHSRSYEISKSELQVGDLVFFSGTYRAGISHMGIYAGNNQFKHAATSTGVATTSLDNPYWSKHFDSFKRFY